MKKQIKIVVSFLMWCLVAGMIGSEAPKVGIMPIVAELMFLVLTVVLAMVRKPQDKGVQTAAVAVEMWVNYIIERLFKNNMFMEKAFSDDQYVLGGAIVHIPQPGARPTVRKNNDTFPVTAVRRTDTDVYYPLDNYTTDPTHIPDTDLAVISYNKIASIINDHFGYLIQDMGDDLIYKWLNELPEANVIRTSGAATAATASGQTGNRLAMVAANLQKARLVLNKQNIPQDGRYALIQSDMMQQMVDSLSITQYRDFSREYDAATGTIGKLYGFNIMERSTTGIAEDTIPGGGLVAADFETAVGGTDQVACLCWHENAVARALGERKMFQNIGDPLYYGDIHSFLARMGGRRRRADSSGVVAIMQATA